VAVWNANNVSVLFPTADLRETLADVTKLPTYF
jgi:hypothetical protein